APLTRTLSESNATISRTSAPAANAFSNALAITTVRASGSASASERRAERASTTGIESTFTGGESSVRRTVPPFRSKWTRSWEWVSAIGGGIPRRPIYLARLRAAREERRDDLVRDVPPRG